MEEFEEKINYLIEELIKELNENCEELKNWNNNNVSIDIDEIECKFIHKYYCNIDYFCCDTCTENRGFLCESCIDIIENFKINKFTKLNRKRIKSLNFTIENFDLLKKYILTNNF